MRLMLFLLNKTYRKIWQRMCGTQNVAVDMFLFDEQRLLLRIGLDFFDGQRDQFTLALGCSAKLCRCQEVHANLEFVS